MKTVSIAEAQANLPELIHQLAPGEELAITDDDQIIAHLVSKMREPAQRKLGTLRGTILYIAPDFDAPLEDFKDYLS